MANRDTYDVTSPKSEVQILTCILQGDGAGDLVLADPSPIGGEVISATRTAQGEFDLVFRHPYAQLVGADIGVQGATPGLSARLETVDVTAKTAHLIVQGIADGTAAAWQTGVTVTAHEATLPEAGVVTSVIATTETGLFPAWQTGVVVAANTATLDVAGQVIAVHATTETGTAPAWLTGQVVAAHTITLTGIIGTVVAVEATTADQAGVKQIQEQAAPDEGFVRVAYTAGVATLTFNATDNVTACSISIIRPGLGIKGKEIISTGTPRIGQCTVTYGATGIATLTFAATDNVTAASVLVKRKGELQAVKEIIHTGTPGAGQVKVVYTGGVPTLTFNTADAVTVAAVAQFPGDAASAATDPTSDDFVYVTLFVRNSNLN